MNRYELTYIIDTALEEEARKELIEKVSALIAQNGGEVLPLPASREACRRAAVISQSSCMSHEHPRAKGAQRWVQGISPAIGRGLGCLRRRGLLAEGSRTSRGLR